MSPPPSGSAKYRFLEDEDHEEELATCRRPYDDFEEEGNVENTHHDLGEEEDQDSGEADGAYYNEDDDCIGDDYADDDWESSYDSSEADSDNYCQLWPDPFEEGTEASSAPRSPTPSMAGEAILQVPLSGIGFCWQAEPDWISDGLKVVCLSRPPDWRHKGPQGSVSERAAAGDFSLASSAFSNCLHSNFASEAASDPCASNECINTTATTSGYDHAQAAGDFRRCPEAFWVTLHQKAGWPSGRQCRNEAPVEKCPNPTSSSKAGQCPGKAGRRLVYTRQRPGSLRPRPPPARPDRRSAGLRSSRPQAATKGGPPSLLRASKEDSGAGTAPEEVRAKTPFYEVTEEEFERLWLSGAVGGASEVEDEVYEISEEDFDRLLKAGQLQLARLEDPGAASLGLCATDNDASVDLQARRPTKRPRPRAALPEEALLSSLPTPLAVKPPPPMTAPSVPARRSSEPAPRRRRPRTVDGSEAKKASMGFCSMAAERTPRGEVLQQRAAAGSPARLLRSLRASISGSVVPLTEAEEEGETRVARRLPANGRLPRISLPNSWEALRKSSSCVSGTDAGGESDMSSPSPVLLPNRSPAQAASQAE